MEKPLLQAATKDESDILRRVTQWEYEHVSDKGGQSEGRY